MDRGRRHSLLGVACTGALTTIHVLVGHRSSCAPLDARDRRRTGTPPAARIACRAAYVRRPVGLGAPIVGATTHL